MKKNLLILFGVLFLSCQEKNNNITTIRVLYNNILFESPNSIPCDEIIYTPPKNDTLDYDNLFIDYFGILDTIITNNYAVKEISTALSHRQYIDKVNIDARMKCYFIYKDNKIDSLCIDQIPNYGMYNNIPVKLSNEFIYLIRKNSGFYEWMGLDQMKYFEELNDSTFVREKVRSRHGIYY